MIQRTRGSIHAIARVAWLVAANGRRTGRDMRLGRVTTIGRDGLRNDVMLDDSAVSATHAKIRLERGRFVLYDLGSTNGTSVNGRRIQKQMLMDEDEISLGRTVLIFKQVGK